MSEPVIISLHILSISKYLEGMGKQLAVFVYTVHGMVHVCSM